MATAVIRADATPILGAGHIRRGWALADALAGVGWEVTFTCGEKTLETVPTLGGSPHSVFVLNETQAFDTPLTALLTAPCDLLIVDHYGLDRCFESKHRGWAKNILVIDDLANRPHECDLLLDTALGRSAEDYSGLVPSSCRLLVGPGHALLRPQFSEYRERALARRRAGDEVGRILVSLGGVPPLDVLSMVLAGIDASAVAAAVDVVLGSLPSSALEDVGYQSGKTKAGMPLQLLSGVEDMAALMCRADVALGAGGVTTWERCCLGLPTVMIPTAENQVLQATELANRGGAFLIEPGKTVTAERIAAALIRLCGQSDERAAMTQVAASLCDGTGVVRVMEEIGGLR